MERLGIEKIRKETVYAPEADKRKLLDRLQRSKAISKDAWLEGEAPVHPTQFVQIEPMESGNRMTRVTAAGKHPAFGGTVRGGRRRGIAIFNLAIVL